MKLQVTPSERFRDITMLHHVELGTPAWMTEARSFLAQETRFRRKALGQSPFSLSERFTDAPPHLGFDRDSCSWTIRYDGSETTIEPGFDDQADLVVEMDYQHALFGAQFVGVSVPGGAEEMHHELTHLFGRDAVSSRGRIESREGRVLIDLMHDHMARRTVENPDLAHRARKLGLAGQIRDVERDGFTIIEHAISNRLTDAGRETILNAVQPGRAISGQSMLYQGRAIERIVLNPKILTLFDASLNRGAQLASMAGVVRGPGKSQVGAHTDYVHVPEPYPDMALSAVSVWSFEDWSAASGPTWIIPGSHRMRRDPRPGDDLSGALPMEMPKGSVVFFTEAVWHWQGDRTEPGTRVSLHPHFNREYMRSIEPKRPTPQLLDRNPPRLGEMLGEDDWFDKETVDGRDHMRRGHMHALQRFTSEKKAELLA